MVKHKTKKESTRSEIPSVVIGGTVIGYPNQGKHSDLGNWQSNNAWDISVPIGTPVYAPYDGVIGNRIGSTGKGGRFAGKRLYINHGNQSVYLAHLSDIIVSAGQKVKAGQLIGYTGEANGSPHIHIGVKIISEKWKPIEANDQAPASQQTQQQAGQRLSQEQIVASVPANTFISPAASPSYQELIDGPSVPGSAYVGGYTSKKLADTWQLIASHPMASPEAQMYAQNAEYMINASG